MKPVDDAVVETTLPFLCPTVRAIIQLQQLTGMRSGEMVILRGMDIDATGRSGCTGLSSISYSTAVTTV